MIIEKTRKEDHTMGHLLMGFVLALFGVFITWANGWIEF